jgi:hypothetical protein
MFLYSDSFVASKTKYVQNTGCGWIKMEIWFQSHDSVHLWLREGFSETHFDNNFVFNYRCYWYSAETQRKNTNESPVEEYTVISSKKLFPKSFESVLTANVCTYLFIFKNIKQVN